MNDEFKSNVSPLLEALVRKIKAMSPTDKAAAIAAVLKAMKEL
jgi:hypothetical protein